MAHQALQASSLGQETTFVSAFLESFPALPPAVLNSAEALKNPGRKRASQTSSEIQPPAYSCFALPFKMLEICINKRSAHVMLLKKMPLSPFLVRLCNNIYIRILIYMHIYICAPPQTTSLELADFVFSCVFPCQVPEEGIGHAGSLCSP